jgi:hypothetical protein
MEASHRTSGISGGGASVVTFWADDMGKVLVGIAGTDKRRPVDIAAVASVSSRRSACLFWIVGVTENPRRFLGVAVAGEGLGSSNGV